MNKETHLQLVQNLDDSLVNCLEHLLALAKQGKINGLCYVARYSLLRSSMGIVGQYESKPLEGLRVADKLAGVLERRVSALEVWE